MSVLENSAEEVIAATQVSANSQPLRMYMVRCPYQFSLGGLYPFVSSGGTYPTGCELGFGNGNGIFTLGALNEMVLAGRFISITWLEIHLAPYDLGNPRASRDSASSSGPHPDFDLVMGAHES